MQSLSGERERIVQLITDYFRTTEVRRVSLFGSFVRSELDPPNDIDILMEVDHPVGYLRIVEYKQGLEALIHRKVDLFTLSGISPKIIPYIKNELVMIYESP